MSLQQLAVRLPRLSEVMGTIQGFFIVLAAAIFAFVLPLEAAAAAIDLENGVYTKRQDTMQCACYAEGLRRGAFEALSDFEAFKKDGTKIQFLD
ncbi:hypothetical protein DL764_001971 [Monosporascus ibericus]|uniref:Uncharacterized protein n=1 Tax=Monosporascus ibericus TaxID=155417 RepID=A0A4Q4TME0_9PEZI|nr:hypothetical protein DL764_001971 [Monosporascus ibericus]